MTLPGAVMCLVLLGASPTHAAVYQVYPDGSGDFPTIQDAIDAADDGDVIELADGTFTGDGNRDIDFLGKAVTVRSQSDNPETCFIDCLAGADDPHRAFVFHSGETLDSVLQAVTVLHGYSAADGGALSIKDSSPTIVNCKILDSVAQNGGGVDIAGTGAPLFMDCLIACNTADAAGGGVCCHQASPTFSGCVFIMNKADANGGGIFCQNTGPVVVDACQIVANETGGCGGGLAFLHPSFDPSVLMISGSEISGNTAEFDGGGVSFQAGDDLLHMDRSVLQRNEAGSSGGSLGLAFTSANGAASIDNCIFAESTAQWSGGGIDVSWGRVTMTNCLVTGNESDEGAGILMWNSDAALVNCSVALNAAADWIGGGLVLWDSNTLIHNCILWSNTAPGQQGDQLALIDTSVATVSHSNLQGGQDAVYVDLSSLLWKAGNINADPLFVDPDNDDYRLSPGSPCIDAANNEAVPADEFDLDEDGDTDEPVPYDLDGDPRFVDDPDTDDTGLGDPPIVDMGAYEFQIDTCPADVTGDGVVDVLDLLAVLAAWGQTGELPEDITGDGLVDTLDLLEVLAAWGPCP